LGQGRLDPHQGFWPKPIRTFTRQGHSPVIKFPRILGIEACGLVEEARGAQFKKN
jgi:hypothetical protein